MAKYEVTLGWYVPNTCTFDVEVPDGATAEDIADAAKAAAEKYGYGATKTHWDGATAEWIESIEPEDGAPQVGVPPARSELAIPDKNQRLLEAYRQLAIHFAQTVVSGPQPFEPPEDGDWLRSSLEDCANLEPDPERAQKLKAALWYPVMYLNTYECKDCNLNWSDEHSCQCDDECPKCGNSFSPFVSSRL